jgi:RNA polymerase sigma-70 factor, ECF subfamily
VHGAHQSVQAVLSSPDPVAVSPETDSWQAAYKAHFRRVWRSLRRLGVAEAALDDAVQDVFLVMYRRWGEFEGRSSVTHWIYGIALRVAHDYRRSARRHAVRVRLIAEEGWPSPGPSGPESELERREATRLLHRLLDTLSEQERALLVLVDLEQVPVRETPELIGLSLATCQRRLYAARRAFNRAVERYVEPSQRRLVK